MSELAIIEDSSQCLQIGTSNSESVAGAARTASAMTVITIATVDTKWAELRMFAMFSVCEAERKYTRIEQVGVFGSN